MDEHETEMDSSIAVIRRLQDGLRAERETNKRLIIALEWYADMDNYETSVHFNNDNMDWCEGAILSDLGTRARIALGRPRKSDIGKGE